MTTHVAKLFALPHFHIKEKNQWAVGVTVWWSMTLWPTDRACVLLVGWSIGCQHNKIKKSLLLSIWQKETKRSYFPPAVGPICLTDKQITLPLAHALRVDTALIMCCTCMYINQSRTLVLFPSLWLPVCYNSMCMLYGTVDPLPIHLRVYGPSFTAFVGYMWACCCLWKRMYSLWYCWPIPIHMWVCGQLYCMYMSGVMSACIDLHTVAQFLQRICAWKPCLWTGTNVRVCQVYCEWSACFDERWQLVLSWSRWTIVCSSLSNDVQFMFWTLFLQDVFRLQAVSVFSVNSDLLRRCVNGCWSDSLKWSIAVCLLIGG